MSKNYTEEEILVSGELFEDEGKVTPVPLENKELRFDFRKVNSDIHFTIPDAQITKEGHSYSFVIGKDITSRYTGNFDVQVSVIENGSVVKATSARVLTIESSIHVLDI